MKASLDLLNSIDMEQLGKSFSVVRQIANTNLQNIPEEKRGENIKMVSSLNKVVRELKDKGFQSENIEKLNDELTKTCRDLGAE